MSSSSKMTPSEVGSWAALNRWAKEDPAANAARGQRGLQDRFLREVDEHAAALGEELTEAERQRRAVVRFKLHMKAVRRARTLKSSGGGRAA